MKAWCVVDCEPGREDTAKRNLEAQGFTVYQPYFVRKVSHARKVKQVRKPLFFQYAFVEIDFGEQEWRCINGTRGVSHILLGSDQMPGIVSDRDMARIRAKASEYREELYDYAPLTKDQVVVIISGAFQSFTGTVRHISGDGFKVEVDANIFGRLTKTTIPRDALQPV